MNLKEKLALLIKIGLNLEKVHVFIHIKKVSPIR